MNLSNLKDWIPKHFFDFLSPSTVVEANAFIISAYFFVSSKIPQKKQHKATFKIVGFCVVFTEILVY